MSKSENSSHFDPRGASVSLRLRLTLLIIAVFAVMQVTLSVLSLVAMRKALDDEASGTLSAWAMDVAHALSSGQITEERFSRLVSPLGRGLSDKALSWSVYSESGPLIADASGREPSDSGIIRDAFEAKDTVTRVRTLAPGQDDREHHARATAVPFVGADGTRYAVLVETNVPMIDNAMERINRIVVISTPFGLTAAAIAGWYVAGVAVRPFARLRYIAQHMGPQSMGQKITINSSASEITRLQDDLNNAMSRLDAGYQAQERFIANISHEIKTPIATVLTEAQTLGRRDALPADVRQFLKSAEDEMRRLGQLVESFLLLARVREGKGIFTIDKTYPVNELVMESIKHCDMIAEKQGVALLPTLLDPEEDEANVRGDPALLRTLIDNLVRNALRFSPKGQRVEVDVHRDGESVCIGVRDHGPGIPPDVLSHVFDRFSQTKSEQRLGRGSGLGLEIAKGIAELHGGDIHAKNNPDGGCLFTICLPHAVIIPDSTAGQSRSSLLDK